MGLFKHSDDHEWSQQHLSHYVEGDLNHRAKRRLDRHAADCPDCSRGMHAMRALVRLIPDLERHSSVRAPAGVFDRVRSESAGERPPQDLPRDA